MRMKTRIRIGIDLVFATMAIHDDNGNGSVEWRMGKEKQKEGEDIEDWDWN